MKLKDRLDQISDLENIKEFNERFLPKIVSIYNHIEEMEKSNMEVRECIA